MGVFTSPKIRLSLWLLLSAPKFISELTATPGHAALRVLTVRWLPAGARVHLVSVSQLFPHVSPATLPRWF